MKWATRPRCHVDRTACAWLITRFIDPDAEFVFVEDVDDVPTGATPFDMRGVELGHVDGGCSFERFLEVYDLHEPGLRHIAEIVHEADVGDERFHAPEAAGIDLAIRALAVGRTDEELFEQAGRLYDGLRSPDAGLSYRAGVPTMSVMRRVLLGLSVIAAVGCLSACGASVKSTLDPVAAAATKSQQAGGFLVTTSVTVSADGREFTMTGSGLFGDGKGQMDLDMSDLLNQAGVAAGTDATIKAIYVTEDGDPVMYMKLGFLSAFMPGGKTWVRVDLAKAGKAAGIDFNQLLGGANQSPGDSLALLRSSGEFSEVGKETVDGVETTHYHGTIDLQKAVAAKGAAAEALQRLIDLGAPTQYPADVWIDEAGLVRQFKTSYDMSTGGKAMSVSMTMGMSDYGTPVEVSAPPADQVFDATDLAVKGVASQLKTPSA